MTQEVGYVGKFVFEIVGLGTEDLTAEELFIATVQPSNDAPPPFFAVRWKTDYII